MRQTLSILVAAAMTVTGSVASFTPAEAVTMPSVSPALATGGEPGGAIELVQRRGKWRYPRAYHPRLGGLPPAYHPRIHRPRAHYPRYRNRYYSRRYYDHDYYDYDHGPSFHFSLGIPFVIGSSAWSHACARKYNSFVWSTGLFLGYDGSWHRCVLP